MKKFLICLVLITAPLLASAGISVFLGDDNFYGQVQLGNVRPQVIYPEPVIIEPGTGRYPPMYLHVPPGYERNWSMHCGRYNACGRPVYFVNDYWYRHTYAPQWRHDHHYRGYEQGPRFDHRRPHFVPVPDRRHEHKRHHQRDQRRYYDRH